MANDAMVGWAWALAVLALLHGFLPFVFERLFTEKSGCCCTFSSWRDFLLCLCGDTPNIRNPRIKKSNKRCSFGVLLRFNCLEHGIHHCKYAAPQRALLRR
jgi:hypothetical protein